MSIGPIGNQPQTIQGVPEPNIQQPGKPGSFGAWQVTVVHPVHPYLDKGAKGSSFSGSILSKRKVVRQELESTNGLAQQAGKLDKEEKDKKSAKKFNKPDNRLEILGKYMAQAKGRAFPNVSKILKAWGASENKEKSNQELRDIVSLCTKDANWSSVTPLTYLKDSIGEKLPKGSEFAKELMDSIQKSIGGVEDKPRRDYEKFLRNETQYRRFEAEAIKGLGEYAQKAKKADIASEPLATVEYKDLRHMAAEQAKATTANQAGGGEVQQQIPPPGTSV